MTPSKNFFDLNEHFEGCKLTAYQDESKVWTIGFGTTHYPNGKAVQEGDACTFEQAKSYLISHIRAEQIPIGVNQAQFDALLDFIYQEGQAAFDGSTLKKSILAHADADTITKDFCMWDKEHIAGEFVDVPGILRREKCRAYLFLNGVNHPTFYL